MENFAFEELPKADSLFKLGTIEKMKGYTSLFSISIFSYIFGAAIAQFSVHYVIPIFFVHNFLCVCHDIRN